MNKNNQIGHNIKRQITRFLKKNISDLSKPQQRFAFDMLFGITKSTDSKITCIGRALNEQQDLCYTVKRLYNNLNNHDYSKELDQVTLNSYNRDVNEDTVFALDFSDITKPYAKRMDNLTTIRDGDKGTIGMGYSSIAITATEMGEENPTILANKLFSKTATPDLKSTDVTLEILKDLQKKYGKKGVYTQDRYFDNKRFYQYYSSNGLLFVTRAKTNRKLQKVDNKGKIVSGKVPIQSLAKGCKTSHSFFVERWENGQWKKKKKVRIGSRKVFLPCLNQIVNMVIIKGFGKVPMMLMTNIDIKRKEFDNIMNIFDIYRTRWKTEEWIRFIKTEFKLEDIRCLNWRSINNLISFVNLATIFIVSQIAFNKRAIINKEKIIRAGKPVFYNKAKMTLYMITYGLRAILKNISANFRKLNNYIVNDIQLELEI